MKWLITIVFLCLCALKYRGDIWEAKWAFLIAIIIVIFSVHVAKKLHWSVGLATLSTLLSSWYVGPFGYNHFSSQLNEYSLRFLHYQGCLAIIYFATVALFCVHIKQLTLQYFKFTFGVFSLVSAAYYIAQVLSGPVPGTKAGFLGNMSLNTGMIVVTAPFILTLTRHPVRWLLYTISVSTILYSPGASTPWFIAMVQVPVLLAMRTHRFFARQLWPVAITLISFGLLIAAYFSKYSVSQLINLNSRLDQYLIFIKRFLDTNILLGEGQGSFMTMSVLRDMKVNESAKHVDLWYWAHSDVLQVLVEQGIIGLSFTLLCVFYAVKKTFQNRSAILLSSLVSYFVLAVCYFPVHWPIEALTGGLILTMSFRLSGEAHV